MVNLNPVDSFAIELSLLVKEKIKNQIHFHVGNTVH